MKIPINARVECTDGFYGLSTYVVVDRGTHQLTHVVVKVARPPADERLVPIDRVAATTETMIVLNSTRQDMDDMENFFVESYMHVRVPDYSLYPDVVLMGSAENYLVEKVVAFRDENLPESAMAVHHGARVEATDGPVGQVDDLLVDPTTEQITHLVLRKGHPWGQKEVVIPLTQVRCAERDVVYLKLDKKAIAALPATPAQPPLRPMPPKATLPPPPSLPI
jgi:sporulation protein YlmC with PRC-barrel domain